MRISKTSLYFAIISFLLACGKSKVVDSELAEAAKALNAFAQVIEENSTDNCNKMANALEKPVQNLKKVLAKMTKISIELKDKKVKPTKEAISARDRVHKASTKLLTKCAGNPRMMRLFQNLQPKSTD